jgi:predicted secreted protein
MTLKINRIKLSELQTIRVKIPDSKKILELPMDEFIDLKLDSLSKDDLIFDIRELQKIISKIKQKGFQIEFDIEET